MYAQITRNRRLAVLWMVIFFVIWTGIGALVGWLSAVVVPMTGRPFVQIGQGAPGLDVLVGALVAGVLAVAGIGFALHSGARVVLAAAGATPADPVRYRQLHNLVEALALGDGLPVPAIYVVDDPAPNAFATGSAPDRAAVTVTTGLLATMDREELEGVLAHELSHIKNQDVRLLLVVGTLIGMAGMLAGLAWRSSFFVRGRGRQGQQMVLVAMLAGLLLTAVAFVFGPLIRLALSRQRESLADVSAVELTRNPVGLLRALRSLQDSTKPLARRNASITAMCIHDPTGQRGSRLQHLLSTHPSLDERIAVLDDLAQATTV